MKKTGLIIALLFVLVVTFDKLIMPLYISQGQVKVVPNVINMDYDDAVQELRRSGLEATKSYHVKYLSQVQSNLVLMQIPAAGQEVKPGRTVYLVVNRREKPSFSMPDLLGRPEFDARQTAARMDITILDVQLSKVTKPEEDGRVLSQSIPAETLVKSGVPVSITIGRYEESAEEMKKVPVPDVLGMSLVQAEQMIADAGFTMGRVTVEYSAILVPNTVISQKPAVNALVPPGQAVELTVVTAE